MYAVGVKAASTTLKEGAPVAVIVEDAARPVAQGRKLPADALQMLSDGRFGPGAFHVGNGVRNTMHAASPCAGRRDEAAPALSRDRVRRQAWPCWAGSLSLAPTRGRSPRVGSPCQCSAGSSRAQR